MGSNQNRRRRRLMRLAGGFSVKDFVKPTRDPKTGTWEKHMIPGNYIGPGTRVAWRIGNNVKPTTNTDAGAQRHDADYYNIRSKLNRRLINRKQAYDLVKQSDNRLLRTAMANTMSINPIEKAHAVAAAAGMTGKKLLQSVGLMDELKFVNGDQMDEINLQGAGKKKSKKKKDNLKGLRKRFKNL
jgi:hypothetical protein